MPKWWNHGHLSAVVTLGRGQICIFSDYRNSTHRLRSCVRSSLLVRVRFVAPFVWYWIYWLICLNNGSCGDGLVVAIDALQTRTEAISKINTGKWAAILIDLSWIHSSDPVLKDPITSPQSLLLFCSAQKNWLLEFQCWKPCDLLK